MTKRRCYYSFHYEPDSHRAARVRQIGAVEGSQPATDNDWESVLKGKDAAIKRWIDDQMNGRSCTVVLVGSATANRPWINYEIEESWKRGMGVVGIRIHGLKNLAGEESPPGANPFDYVAVAQVPLSTIVRCYDPPGGYSRARYVWISHYLAAMVEEAITIRNRYR